MEVFYITVLLSHNTYYGSFYMLVMFGKTKKVSKRYASQLMCIKI